MTIASSTSSAGKTQSPILQRTRDLISRDLSRPQKGFRAISVDSKIRSDMLRREVVPNMSPLHSGVAKILAPFKNIGLNILFHAAKGTHPNKDVDVVSTFNSLLEYAQNSQSISASEANQVKTDFKSVLNSPMLGIVYRNLYVRK